MTLVTKKKLYCGKLALATTTLLATLSVVGLANAADITTPIGGTEGTFNNPYVFINTTIDNTTNNDTVTVGSIDNLNISLLNTDPTKHFVVGLQSTSTALGNIGDINLFISKEDNMFSSVFAAGISGNSIANNQGDITIYATGGNAEDGNDSGDAYAEAYVDAYGITGNQINSNVTTNNGAITVQAEGGSAEAFFFGHADALADANANATASGIFGNVTINNGTIDVIANGGSAEAYAYELPETYDHAWTRAGAVAQARGIDGDVGINTGDITVTANGGDAKASTVDVDASTYAYAMAYGILGSVTSNTGDITVDAIGGTATADSTPYADAAAFAYGIFTEQTSLLTNSGKIDVTATAGTTSTDGGETFTSDDVRAYGIYFGGEVPEGYLYSSGLILAKASLADGYTGGTAEAYQVYSAGALTITGYAMKFNNQEQVDADYAGSIWSTNEKNSVFSSATLYAYTDNGFNNKTSYEIPTLVEDADISDQFSTVTLGVTSPDYTLTLINGEGTELQQLSIEYTPQNSTPLMATQVAQKITSNGNNIVHSNLMSPMLSMMQQSNPTLASYEGVRLVSTDPIVNAADMNLESAPPEAGWAFVMPYYTDLSDSSSPMGYDANIYGITGGYNHWVSSDFILGFHAGYGNGDIDFTGTGYDQKEEDVDAGSLGVQGIYNLGNNWLVDGLASFFYTSNDYSDSNPLNRESGDYNTHGIDANINLSYVYTVDPHNRLVPAFGLRYLWQHDDSFTATNLDNADVHYGDVDENQVYAHLGVDWFGDYLTDSKWHVVPTVGVGVEQALTDNEFDNTMMVGNASSTVTNEMDDTSLTTNAAIEFSKDSVAFTAGYSGSYSSDVKDSSVYLQMKYFF